MDRSVGEWAAWYFALKDAVCMCMYVCVCVCVCVIDVNASNITSTLLLPFLPPSLPVAALQILAPARPMGSEFALCWSRVVVSRRMQALAMN
jgi:hypothetical protein